MRRSLLLFAFVFAIFKLSQAQIVITEISYNPPESGNDSLEYIEIYNAGNIAVDLTGYRFVNGVDYVFPGIDLGAGDYLLIAFDSAAIFRQFGVAARQWTAGALNNSGERIAIEDASNNLVDEVEYDDEGDWPTTAEGTDGEGASIELCDPASDNFDGSSWRAADNDLGIVINGRAVKGTPGSANTVRCLPAHDHYISVQSNFFTPKDITINVGETILWENLGGVHNVNGSTATFPSNPESFSSGAPSGSNWTFTHTFNTAGSYNYQCDPHAGLGMTGTVTVQDIDPFPMASIGEITSNNAAGVPDSLGKSFTIEGVVHGPNFFTGGTQLNIIDDQRDGIEIFNQNSNFGYTPQLGDRLRVKGTVNQYFGLTQFNIAELELLSSGNNLFDPREVTMLDEDTESDLIELKGLTLVDPASWGMGTASGFNVLATNGQDTFNIRVDAESELFGPNGPGSQSFDLIGLGGQFDRDEPLYDGYQIWPRYISDLKLITSTTPAFIAEVKLYPNPATDWLFISTDQTFEEASIYSISGEKVRNVLINRSNWLGDLLPGTYILKLVAGKQIGALTFQIQR